MRKLSLLTILLVWLGMCACCVSPQPVVEYPPIDQLLIDESPFPEGWEASDPDTDSPPLAPWTSGRREIEYVSRSFHDSSDPSGAAGMTIQRFKHTRDAANEYEHEKNVTFRVRDEEAQTPWETPAGISFESDEADQYLYGCTEVFGQARCAYVAQYGVYVVSFDVSLYDTNVVTYTDLLPIFLAIDERMAQHLGER